MNSELTLYRKRFIPNEITHLKNDVLLFVSDDLVVTKWNCLKPRLDISYGFSAYFLKEGFKLSKIFREDHTLAYWYCDIITYEYEEFPKSLIVTDLLVDIVVYENGTLRVLDLDELADALETNLIDVPLACQSLRNANHLLSLIADDSFHEYQACLDSYVSESFYI